MRRLIAVLLLPCIAVGNISFVELGYDLIENKEFSFKCDLGLFLFMWIFQVNFLFRCNSKYFTESPLLFH